MDINNNNSANDIREPKLDENKIYKKELKKLQ